MKKKSVSVLLKGFLMAMIAGLIGTLLLNVSTLRAVGEIKRGRYIKTGYFWAIIGSGSMEPTVSVNDLLFIRGGDFFQAEDIVTYVSERGTLITHRVKAVVDGGYVTQGDANNIPDEEIRRQRMLGKAVLIVPGVGSVISGIFSPAGIILLACIFSAVLLIRKTRRGKNEEEHKNAEYDFYDDPES